MPQANSAVAEAATKNQNPIRQSFRRFRRSLSAQRNKEMDCDAREQSDDDLRQQSSHPQSAQQNVFKRPALPTNSYVQPCAIAKFDEDDLAEHDYVNGSVHGVPQLVTARQPRKQSTQQPATAPVLTQPQPEPPLRSKSLTARARELFRPRSSSRSSSSRVDTQIQSEQSNLKSSVRVVKCKSKLSGAARSSSVAAFATANSNSNSTCNVAPAITDDDLPPPNSFRRSSSISRSISSLFASVRRRSRSRSGDRSVKSSKRHTVCSNESTAERFAGVYQSGSRSPSPPRSSTSTLRHSSSTPYASSKCNSLPQPADPRRVAAAFARFNSPFAYADLAYVPTNDLDCNFAALQELVHDRPSRLTALTALTAADQTDFAYVPNASAQHAQSVCIPPQCVRVWLRTSRRAPLARSATVRRSVSQSGRRAVTDASYSADTCPLMAPCAPAFDSSLSPLPLCNCSAHNALCSAAPACNATTPVPDCVYVNVNVNVDVQSPPLPPGVASIVTNPSPAVTSASASPPDTANSQSTVDNRYSTATVLSGCSSATTDSAVELCSASSSDRESRCRTRNSNSANAAHSHATPSLEPVTERRNETPVIVNVVHVASDCSQTSKSVDTNSVAVQAQVNAESSERGSLDDIPKRVQPPLKGRCKRLVDDLTSVNSLDDDGFYTSMTTYSLRQSLVSLENKPQSNGPSIQVPCADRAVQPQPPGNLSVEIIEMSTDNALAASCSTPQFTPVATQVSDSLFDNNVAKVKPPVRDAYKLCMISSVSSFDDEPSHSLRNVPDRPHSILKRVKDDQVASSPVYDKAKSVSTVAFNSECAAPMQPLMTVALTKSLQFADGNSNGAECMQPDMRRWSLTRAVPRSVSFASSRPILSSPLDSYEHCSAQRSRLGSMQDCTVPQFAAHAVPHCCHLTPCCPQTLVSRQIPARCNSLALPCTPPSAMLSDTCSDQSFYLPSGRRPPQTPQNLHNQLLRRAQRNRTRTPPAPPKRTVTRSQVAFNQSTSQYDSPIANAHDEHRRDARVPMRNVDSSSADDADTDCSLSKLDTSAQLGRLVSRLSAAQVCEPGSPVYSNYRKLYSLSNPLGCSSQTPPPGNSSNLFNASLAHSANARQKSQDSLRINRPSIAPENSSLPPTETGSDFEDDSLDDDIQGESRASFSRRQRSYRYAMRCAK